MHSAIYFGRVRHQRYLPKAHAFSYRVCLLWLDLSELPAVFSGRSSRNPTVVIVVTVW